MGSSGSSDITVLLRAWSGGDATALDHLATVVYDELRMIARRYRRNERACNTLQTTAIVNEVYLRLVKAQNIDWAERAQFFHVCAQMMRRILVDAARARGAHKRGAGALKINIDDAPILAPELDDSILALHEALQELARLAPRQAEVVELRYFAGLNEEQTAEVLKISDRSVRRDWQFAKAWLAKELALRR